MKKTIVLSIALAGLAAAQGPPGQPSPFTGVVRLNKAPVSNEVLKVKLPRPVEQKLSNGMRLLVVENHKVPTISLQMAIPSGTLQDPEDMRGIAEATAALIRLGTKTRNSKDLAEAMADVGASINFGTGQDSGSIFVSSLTENFDPALALLADILLNPTFPQDELDKWKTRQKSNLQQAKTNPGSLASERMFKVLYPSDARQYTLPTVASIDKVTREKVMEHYKAYYVPSGEWAGIAGDITPKEAAAKLEKALAGWKGGPVKHPSLPMAGPLPDKKVMLISRPNSVQTFLLVVNRAIDRMSPDYVECQVMNRVLGSGPSSRLFRNIREAKGYTYGIGSGFSASKVLNFFVTNTSVRTEVTEPALTEVLKEFQAIREVPVPAVELADAKSAIVAGFVLALENPSGVLSRWLEQREYGLPEEYWDQYPAKVQAVTAAEVLRVAKKYVPLDNAQIIAVGDAAKIGEVLKKFGPVEQSNPDN